MRAYSRSACYVVAVGGRRSARALCDQIICVHRRISVMLALARVCKHDTKQQTRTIRAQTCWRCDVAFVYCVHTHSLHTGGCRHRFRLPARVRALNGLARHTVTKPRRRARITTAVINCTRRNVLCLRYACVCVSVVVSSTTSIRTRAGAHLMCADAAEKVRGAFCQYKWITSF